MTGEQMAGSHPDDREKPTGRRNAQGIRIDPDTEAELDERRAVISALVDHQPGVLAKVSGLFARRQLNIESLTVGPTVDESLARMTIVVEEDEPGIEQAKRQLRKEIHAWSVEEVEAAVERELALIKVSGSDPAGVAAVAETYGGETIQVKDGVLTVELTATEEAIDAAIEAFEQFGVREVARTGTAALRGGTQSTT